MSQSTDSRRLRSHAAGDSRFYLVARLIVNPRSRQWRGYDVPALARWAVHGRDGRWSFWLDANTAWRQLAIFDGLAFARVDWSVKVSRQRGLMIELGYCLPPNDPDAMQMAAATNMPFSDRS